MTGNRIASKRHFAETRYFAKTLLKQFCLGMASNVSKWMEESLLLAKWLQMSRFETFSVVPAGFEPNCARH